MDGISSFLAACLPYCLTLEACGRYRVTNFYGDPLGCAPSVAESSLSPLLSVRITLKAASKLSVYQCRDPEKIYLYAEDRAPSGSAKAWMAYQVRLGLLSKLATLDESVEADQLQAARARSANLEGKARYLEERELVRAWLSDMKKGGSHG